MNLLFAGENTKERERLIRLVGTITDEQFGLTLYKEGWTVAVALAHLAYWDERRRVLLRQWQKNGVKDSPIDADAVNAAMVPVLRLIPPREAANLAVATAEAVDHELKDISPDIVAGIQAIRDIHALDRSAHRKTHLEHIEALLARS